MTKLTPEETAYVQFPANFGFMGASLLIPGTIAAATYSGVIQGLGIVLVSVSLLTVVISGAFTLRRLAQVKTEREQAARSFIKSHPGF